MNAHDKHTVRALNMNLKNMISKAFETVDKYGKIQQSVRGETRDYTSTSPKRITKLIPKSVLRRSDNASIRISGRKRPRSFTIDGNKTKKIFCFFNGLHTDFISRIDFVSDEAWEKFIKMMTYKNNQRAAIHNSYLQRNKTMNFFFIKVIEELENMKHFTNPEQFLELRENLNKLILNVKNKEDPKCSSNFKNVSNSLHFDSPADAEKRVKQELQKVEKNNLLLSSDDTEHHPESVYSDRDEDTDSCHIKQEQESNCKILVEIEDVKVEDCDNVLLIVSSDDALLPLHESIREEKQSETKKPKKDKVVSQPASKVQKLEKCLVQDADTTDNDKEQRKQIINIDAMLDDVDLKKFVTVVRLSTEKQLEEIHKRKKSSNYLKAPFQCHLCYKGFIHTHTWKHHLKKHDPSSGDIECPICKMRFKTKRAVNNHAKNHAIKYICNSCSYVSTSALQAKRHQRWHEGVTYECQQCGNVFTKSTSYLNHMRIKHPTKFICGVCGHSFLSERGLASHKSKMHQDITEKETDGDDTDTGPYCKECDVKFLSVEAWNLHMTSAKHKLDVHLDNLCRVCGETFDSGEELRNHNRTQHAPKKLFKYVYAGHGERALPTWPAKCVQCSEEMPDARQYWHHFRKMHPNDTYPLQKDFVCDVCGKGYTCNWMLVIHKRTHTAERPFSCTTCGKAFYDRQYLRLHERHHQGLLPHPCPICCKGFGSKHALDRHVRSHTGEKPFPCDLCDKSFTQASSRKLHVRTVHQGLPAPPRTRRPPTRRKRASAAPATPATSDNNSDS